MVQRAFLRFGANDLDILGLDCILLSKMRSKTPKKAKKCLKKEEEEKKEGEELGQKKF